MALLTVQARACITADGMVDLSGLLTVGSLYQVDTASIKQGMAMNRPQKKYFAVPLILAYVGSQWKYYPLELFDINPEYLP